MSSSVTEEKISPTDNNIINELKKVFKSFIINYFKYNTYVISSNEKRSNYLTIKILDNIIEVKYIYSEDKIGKSLLMSLATFAKNMLIEKISLSDGSNIEIDKICPYPSGIRLYYLKIITKGESWYNSLGYFSK